MTHRSPDVDWASDGTYAVAGDHITFFLGWVGDFPVTMRWRTEGDNLVFDVLGDVHPTFDAWFTSHPWTKVG